MNVRLRWLVPVFVGLFVPVAPRAQSGGSSGDITFTKDIVPILQRSCQPCHRPDGVAPMPLVTYEQVRPWAREMKVRPLAVAVQRLRPVPDPQPAPWRGAAANNHVSRLAHGNSVNWH